MTDIDGLWPEVNSMRWDIKLKDILKNMDAEVGALPVAYVSVRNFDGTPVLANKYVVLTLTPDGTEVDNIAVYNSLDEVGD